MDLPSHPEADDRTAGQQPATSASRATVVVVVVVVAVLAAVVIAHLAGVVGPGAT